MNYKIFIVSIKRNAKRQKSLLKKLELNGYNLNDIEIINGIDYKNISKEILDKIKSKWGVLTPKSVLCCAASHVLTWEYISTFKNKIDYAILLEDDSYIIKNKFDKYRSVLEEKINDETFLNLSTGVRINKNFKFKDDSDFVDSELVLSLDTYIITPVLAEKLFNYYKKNGLSYHIDLHLSIIKNQVPFKLIHFNRKITKENLRLQSSMVANHDKKFFLKWIQDTETYKELNTPIIEINDFSINAYTVIVCFLFFILLIVTFKSLYFSSTLLSMFVFMFLWLCMGFLFYDMF